MTAPLPLTIVSGYLGAGKTTLINRLLAEDHGMRLAVIVNDFGSINIDESLITAQGDDMIALTNGCVCCTISDDLFSALGSVLDRTDRPDHLIIEASGIADPAAIASTAIAEPELGYAGIVTLVDAQNIDSLLEDTSVAPQVVQQITAADLVLLTKSEAADAALVDRLAAIGARDPRVLDDTSLAPLLFDIPPRERGMSQHAHPAYARWKHDSDMVISRRDMGEKLANRPHGLYRLKGFVLTDDGGYEVHVVGQYVKANRARTDRTRLVALGPADRISPDDIEAWWRG
ncbi:GTP-binding protein [Sedimentitalea sp. XS_ASV28]|uniref:CobW family GTP-binding protein n=1 Tax=Sedimentitalea sp. XS_ASV28 TaxID=3241296 RepID=UPI0035130EDB